MRKYGVYFEFATSSTADRRDVEDNVRRNLESVGLPFHRFSVQPLEPERFRLEEPGNNTDHTFYDEVNKYPSVGEDVLPDDPFAFPHIQALMRGLKHRQGEGNDVGPE